LKFSPFLAYEIPYFNVAITWKLWRISPYNFQRC